MKIFILAVFLVFMAGCTGKPASLENFDEKAWQNDKNGCDNVRAGMMDELESSLDQLKGLSENDILDLLGAPDLNQLYKRNQKFYIYQITPSLECGSTGQASQFFLEIRFSATNLATEIMIKESGR